METQILINILKKNSNESILEHFGDKEVTETYINEIPCGVETNAIAMLEELRKKLGIVEVVATVPIGIHQSFSGFESCVTECKSIGNITFQCFIRNNRNMKQRTFSQLDFQRFNSAVMQNAIDSWVVHASYVMNPASYVDRILDRTIDTIKQDMSILSRLSGEKYYVLHPGAHTDNDRKSALDILVDTMSTLRPYLGNTRICLENMAGQGSQLLVTPDECSYVLDKCEWVDLCLDTCHMFGAGVMHFDFINMLKKYDRNHLGVIHINDSEANFGTRVDRHANVGYGKIPQKMLEDMITSLHGYNKTAPMILETPGTYIYQDLEYVKGLPK